MLENNNSCGFWWDLTRGAGARAPSHSTSRHSSSIRVFRNLSHAREDVSCPGRTTAAAPEEPWAAKQASRRMFRRRRRRPPTRIKPSRPQRPKLRPRSASLASSRRQRQRRRRPPRHLLLADARSHLARPPREGASWRTGTQRRHRPRRRRRAPPRTRGRARRVRRPPGACKPRCSVWMMM